MKIWYALLVVSIVYRLIRMPLIHSLSFLAVCLIYAGIVGLWELTEKLYRLWRG